MELELLEYLSNSEGIKENKVSGMIKDNIINYKLDDYDMIIDILKHTMIRESKEYKYLFDFDNKVLKCILKDQGLDLDIDIEVIDIEMNDKNVYIKYYLKPSKDDIIEYKLILK